MHVTHISKFGKKKLLKSSRSRRSEICIVVDSSTQPYTSPCYLISSSYHRQYSYTLASSHLVIATTPLMYYEYLRYYYYIVFVYVFKIRMCMFYVCMQLVASVRKNGFCRALELKFIINQSINGATHIIQLLSYVHQLTGKFSRERKLSQSQRKFTPRENILVYGMYKTNFSTQ